MIVALPGDEGFRLASDLRALVSELRSAYPAGIDTLLVGRAAANGYKRLATPSGTLDVLVGLLLPTLQELLTDTSAGLALLATTERHPGGLLWVMADGSVRNSSGRPAAYSWAYLLRRQ